MKFEKSFSKILWTFRVVRWLAVLTPLFLFGYFFEQYFDLGGLREVHYDFDPQRQRQMIHSFEPENRILQTEKRLSNGKMYRRFSDEPIYFQLTMPRLYEDVQIELTYSNPSQNIIELGLQKGREDAFQFTFQPVENRIIDLIKESSEWQLLTNKDQSVYLFQKQPIFSSVEDFLNQPPYEQRVAFYKTPLSVDVKLPDYVPATERSTFDITLKGSHTFFTYAKSEDLDISFEFQDVDLQTGSDPVVVQLWRGDELLDTSQVPDDQEKAADSQNSPLKRRLTLGYPDASEGVYKIVFSGSDDVIIRSINTAQHFFVVENRLSLADSGYLKRFLNDLPEQSTPLFSDIPRLRIRALRESALRDVQVDHDVVALDEIKTFFLWERSSQKDEVYPLVVADELELIGRGFFSITRESFFDPNGKVAPLDVHTDENNLDFLLFADYTSPQSRGIWKTASVSFNINKDNIYENNTLRLILSAPELGSLADDILISDIKVVLRKAPFSLREFLHRFR